MLCVGRGSGRLTAAASAGIAGVRRFSNQPPRSPLLAAQPIAADLMLDCVAETTFFSQHRPLAVHAARPGSSHSQNQSQSSSPTSSTSTSSSSTTGGAITGSLLHFDLDSASGSLVPVAGVPSAATATADSVIDSSLTPLQRQTLTLNSSNAEWYNDEYAKLFNAFAPFAPPSHTSHTSESWSIQPDSFAQDAAANGSASSKVFSNDEQLLTHFFNSFSELSLAQSASSSSATAPEMSIGRRERRTGMYDPTSMDEHAMLLIRRKVNIIKIRRKKMNKHKWKKYRRRVRDSSRYNKEKLRKGGVQRKRQE